MRPRRFFRTSRHLPRFSGQHLRGRGRLVGGRQPWTRAGRLPQHAEIHLETAAMKAWRFHGFNDMRLDDVPEPRCGPGQVLVEPLCVQPSVTEAQLAYGIPTLAYDRIKRRLETEAPVQLFGHEFCARILKTGPGVTRYHPGDRIAARAKLPCGDCPLCRSE